VNDWGLYILLLVPTLLLGLGVQWWLRKTFDRYSHIELLSGMTGAEVARQILDRNGLEEVPVDRSNAGALSDNYDPRKKALHLSPPVYDPKTVAAAAVGLLLVAEEFGHREASERDAQAVARRLVHLAEHHGDLGLGQVVELDDTRFHHLVIEIVPFAGPLAHAREHRQARMLGGDVVDELQHVHGLADARAAEQAHLTALRERADEVDHLDAGLEELHRRRELVELGCDLVNRAARFGLDRPRIVDGAPEHVHDAPQRAFADGHRDGRPGALHLHAAAQAVGGAERDAAHDAVAELLLDLEGEASFREAARLARILENERVIDIGHRFARKLDVGDRADALDDGASCVCHGSIPQTAAAPPTISESSLVMPAWRFLL